MGSGCHVGRVYGWFVGCAVSIARDIMSDDICVTLSTLDIADEYDSLNPAVTVCLIWSGLDLITLDD